MRIREEDVLQLEKLTGIKRDVTKTLKENFIILSINLKNKLKDGVLNMRTNVNTFEAVMDELSFGTRINAIFGSYDAVEKQNEILSISEKEVLEHFRNDIVDFKDITNDIVDYKIEVIDELLSEIVNKYDYDSYFYYNDILNEETMQDIQAFNYDMFEEIEDRVFYIVDEIKELEELELDDTVYSSNSNIDGLNIDFNNSLNSYNWASSAVFNVDFININEQDYTLIKFHRYGDVRGNYTSYLLLNLDEQSFLDSLYEIEKRECVEINGLDIYIQYNVTSEYGVYNIWSDEFDIDEQYIDIDNTSIETLQESLKTFLVEEGYITEEEEGQDA